jgi:RHS repeat-associated protein
MKQFSGFLLAVFVFVGTQTLQAGRYYDARIARWTIPDPALREGHPQSQLKKYGVKLCDSSPYNYAFNNPQKFTDPNGNWPRWVHHSMIQQAFSRDAIYGSKISTLQGWSDYADIPRFQTPQFSFRHAMGIQGESQELAISKINTFLNSEVSTDETADFGIKLHAVMDMTSPSHEGEQPWGEVSVRAIDGVPTNVYSKPNILVETLHSVLEMRASIPEQNATVRLMRQFTTDFTNKNRIDIRHYQQLYRRYLQQEIVTAIQAQYDASR